MGVKPPGDIPQKRLFLSTIIAFLSSIALTAAILVVIVSNKAQADKLIMEQMIMEKTERLTDIIHKLLYKTEALAALVVQNNGGINNFERVASTLLDDPAIANLLIAPGGVVSHVYPPRDNEAVLGFDLFKEGAGNREALMAREEGRLVFGGPFALVQGGQALVGRLPVYTDGADGEKAFWGLVSVTLKYPQVLEGLGLDLLQNQGFSFEIWRTDPESGEKRIIAKSSHGYDATARFIEKEMKFLNVVWHFRLAPVKAWHQYAEAWIVIVVGVLGSFLVAFGVQNNQELKVMHRRLEEMAQNDPLTGIANRRHFMAGAEAQLSRAARSGQTCFLILFDVDHFKTINDTHGHAAGDAVLVDVADRIKRIIRPYDLFARYGGEEFVLLVMDMDRNEAVGLAERMRLNFCESPFRFNKADIPVTSSFGLARVAPGDDLVKAIERADKALYSAKEAGRNRTVCHEDQA